MVFLVPPTTLYQPINDEFETSTTESVSGTPESVSGTTESVSVEPVMDESMTDMAPPVTAPSASEPQTPEQSSQGSSKVTQHTDPKWLENLQLHFKTEIVEKCSASTRNAVEMNEKIQVCFQIT